MSSAKRLFDVVLAAAGTIVTAPIIVASAVTIWLGDRRSPLYSTQRIGRHGVPFQLIKLRTMKVGADRLGPATARTGDPRITGIGAFLRKTKIDELPQFWNVLHGDMSLVGPRSTLDRIVAGYTPELKKIVLSVRPGVTGLGSVVFADLDAIMANSVDPEGDYRRLVFPWIGRLEHLYVERGTLATDLVLVGLTILNIVSRSATLRLTSRLVRGLGGDAKLVSMAAREHDISKDITTAPTTNPVDG